MIFDENSSPAERLDAYRTRIAVLEQACGAAAVAMMMDMDGGQIAASAHNSPFMMACRAVGLDPVNAPEKAIEIVAAIRAKGPIVVREEFEDGRFETLPVPEPEGTL